MARFGRGGGRGFSYGEGGDGRVAMLRRRSARPSKPAWPTLKRALTLLQPHRLTVILYLISVVVTALTGLFQPLLLQPIVDKAIPHHNLDLLIQLCIEMLILVLASSFVGVLRSYLNNVIGQDVVYDLRVALYDHLSGMSIRWFTANRTGEVLSRMSNDVGGVQSVLSDTVGSAVENLVTASVAIALMFAFDWRLTLVCLVALPVFVIPSRRVGQRQRELVLETQEEMASQSAHMQETLSISGVLLVKTFGRLAYELGRFRDAAYRIKDLSIRRAMVGRWFQMAMGMFSQVAPVFVFGFGGYEVIHHQTSIGTLVAYAGLLTKLFGPVSSLLNINVTVLSSLALFERIFEYRDLDQEIHDRPDAIDVQEIQGDLRFEHVSFSYVANRPALRDVSFEVPAGKFAALVGPSGAGKTTIAYLVPRLYDVADGRILIDGHDVRDLTLDSLGRSIAMVNQEPFLFHTTIGENLRYARPDATDAEVEAAARAANIHDFIAALPWGYETIVGERGYRLSGGEKQRVAIARALLKDPAILILDEATSSLDSATERAIQAALERLIKGRTVLAIAHRLSTILAADVILVVQDGRILESGRHADLLARGGVYTHLYEQQFAPDRSPEPALAGSGLE